MRDVEKILVYWSLRIPWDICYESWYPSSFFNSKLDALDGETNQTSTESEIYRSQRYLPSLFVAKPPPDIMHMEES
jgi:hypothetical protein